jgi:hypothetical protein
MNKLTVTLLLILCGLILLPTTSFCSQKSTGVIRYDISFVGNVKLFKVIHQQTKFLGENIGAQDIYNDNRDYGNMRFSVYDLTTGEKLYQKGFCPIFQEWLSTPEAKKKSRSFYQGLFFPKPDNDVRITIDYRRPNGKWKNIWSDIVSLSDHWIVREKPAVYPVDTLMYSGSSAEKIDLVILSEGYTLSEKEKFYADAGKMTDTLMNTEPFKEYRQRFNLFAEYVPSIESGSDKPDEWIYRNTPFNTTWNTFESARYLTTKDMKAIYDATDGITWDHLIVLVNEKRYGGGGFYNFVSVCSADNERSLFVFIHEFGHAFAGLADEYYYPAGSTDEPFYRKGVEPWEPNITTLTHFEKKWKTMVDTSLPMPTPRDTNYSGKVGLFEGGGYQASGVYSPVLSCWMKEQKAGGFCPVCKEAIRQTILMESK